jgi:GT2 family glycosyltransferase
MSKLDVTIVISPRERFSLAPRSIAAVYNHTEPPFELIVVDGGSPPAKRRHLERAASERGFRLIRRDHYLSPNEARNLAIAEATTKYIVFADNDVIDFSPGWLGALVACAEETGAGIVGPLICIGEPPHSRVHIAGGMVAFVEEGGRRRFQDEQRCMNRQLAEVADQLKREPCDVAEFHCMMARRAVFDATGPLDEGLMSTREHIDFCMSAKRHGIDTWFEPAAVVTFVQPPPIEVSDIPYYMLRWSDEWAIGSMQHFMKKWDCHFDLENLRRIWIEAHRDVAIEPFRRPLRSLIGRRASTALCAPVRKVMETVLIDRAKRRRPAKKAAPIPEAAIGRSMAST